MPSSLSSQTISFCTADSVKLEADIYPAQNPWCVLDSLSVETLDGRKLIFDDHITTRR
ncbi:hypothetical protein [Acidithiobacillus thiooxidans]|uniref:hypothetical protein n=1 Tax=Acidithiobacillus thiooxidans TaxID=930 RepID=UPI0013015C4D|nr:hypothetical protein [Acidithiobacillus thiooxidans]